MTIDEQELGRLLEETADLSNAPHFTAEGLTRHVRRRRARIITTVSGAVAAAIASAVIVPSALSSHSQTQGSAAPPPLPIQMSYNVTVNGRTQELPFGGNALAYVIKPGEDLAITIDMTIPTRTSVKMTGLWMGITNGVQSAGLNGPADMAPILIADPRASFGPGTHRFTLHWVAPIGLRPGTTRQLSAETAWSYGATERVIAVFNVRDGSSR